VASGGGGPYFYHWTAFVLWGLIDSGRKMVRGRWLGRWNQLKRNNKQREVQ
jgi:hypothetical protein